MELTLGEWKDFLDKETNLKKTWNHFFQKKANEEAIFKILTTHHYDNFEKQKIFNPDTMCYETMNAFEDKKMRWAYIKIREIRGGKFLTKNTFNEMITLIQAIQACQKALNRNKPESQPLDPQQYQTRDMPSYCNDNDDDNDDDDDGYEYDRQRIYNN